MEKLYNEFHLDVNTWGEDNISKKLGDVIRTLTKEKNCCFIREEIDGLYIIQYNHDENLECWGVPTIDWMTSEEYEDLQDKRCELKDIKENIINEDN